MTNTEKDNNKVLRENLISTFHEIDDRIAKLHAHSSDVFLQLNGSLKEYHKKSKIVSDNASNIFSTIIGNEETNMMKDMDILLEKLRNFRQKTRSNTEETHELLNSLIEHTNLAIVQTRNFKQDLLTIGYLLANYQFVKNYQHAGSGQKKRDKEV